MRAKTPLHEAAASLDENSIRMLVEAGVDVNARDEDGNTPLHIIFFSDEYRPDIEFPTFRALVAAGSDRAIRNNKGKTAYDLGKAVRYPQEYLDLLNPDAKNADHADHFLCLDQKEFKGFSSAGSYPIVIEGKTYASVQHYYQSEKWKGTEYEEHILQSPTPEEAMRIGLRSREYPPGAWYGRRDEVMRNALMAQFMQYSHLKETLLATHDRVLIADSHSDRHWLEGHIPFNAIGRMLMSIREELKLSS